MPDPGEIEDMEFMIDSDRLNLILTVLKVKKGTDLELFFKDRDQIEGFKQYLDEWSGLNYKIEENIGSTNLASLYSLFTQRDHHIEDMLNRDFICRGYISYDKKALDRYVRVKFLRRFTGSGGILSSLFHRRAGEFYGFPEQDINAFIYSNAEGLNRKIMELRDQDIRRISSEESFDKYSGSGLDANDKSVFVRLTHHVLADRQDSFEKQLDLVKKREKAAEEIGVKTEDYL
ncbi:hypothetical protein [Candidatus Nanohalococcus occultus]|uniref:Uncharacterized protein n=1 Tax=Candidatus Nanohalococcus occultus TaxID=2978047 RepID=A0ABY8CJP1_9ARCH|nr:hypothetical protein SVXNc_0538 [Candidatus Nanohaloarchaeota archaeon SVXNc]